MIHVVKQVEPHHFRELVRDPGLKFLKSNPKPKSGEWKSYWQRALPDLHDAYLGVCAYSAFWAPDCTVDHFVPKSVSPALAYEWDNFRLATPKMNSRKRDYTDVLDPFEIGNGWFVLEFPSLIVKPNSELSEDTRSKVLATIERLRLNDDDYCLKFRVRWVLEYCRTPDLGILRQVAPFVALELERQGLLNTISVIMGL